MKKKVELTAREKRYLKLSEVYLSRYEDQKDRHVKMLLAKGILVEMESDLAFFHLKNPRTDKSDNQLLRLNMLRDLVDEFSAIHSFNFQINIMLGNLHRENDELRDTIKQLMQKDEEPNGV